MAARVTGQILGNLGSHAVYGKIRRNHENCSYIKFHVS